MRRDAETWSKRFAVKRFARTRERFSIQAIVLQRCYYSEPVQQR
jgi:hypothetical protein